MFGETTIFDVMICNHPIETTVYKQMFQVPGITVVIHNRCFYSHVFGLTGREVMIFFGTPWSWFRSPTQIPISWGFGIILKGDNVMTLWLVLRTCNINRLQAACGMRKKTPKVSSPSLKISIAQIFHVGNIYLHFLLFMWPFLTQCRHIFHTWSIWIAFVLNSMNPIKPSFGQPKNLEP